VQGVVPDNIIWDL